MIKKDLVIATSLRIPSSNIISYDKNLSVEFDVFFGERIHLALFLAQGIQMNPIYLYYHTQIIKAQIQVI